jgi:hypothetical protein
MGHDVFVAVWLLFNAVNIDVYLTEIHFKSHRTRFFWFPRFLVYKILHLPPVKKAWCLYIDTQLRLGGFVSGIWQDGYRRQGEGQ